MIMSCRLQEKQVQPAERKEFGLTSDANGRLFAIPTEKAHKIKCCNFLSKQLTMCQNRYIIIIIKYLS